jgi:hypothetical protein
MRDLNSHLLLEVFLYCFVEFPIFGKGIAFNTGPYHSEAQFEGIVGHESLLYDLPIA